MTLRWVPGWNGLTEPEAVSYVAAVEAADGQELEFGVARAINDFVTGCKQDKIWDAIKACCILAGARTLSGALVPLVGTAPTNFNFVSGDYNRETGLVGDASTKYLDSNRDNSADPQDNQHLAVYVGQLRATGSRFYMASDFAISGTSSISDVDVRSRFTAGQNINSNYLGLVGVTRSSGSAYSHRTNNTTTLFAGSSQPPSSSAIHVFGCSNATPVRGDARLAFYSIGESLDLAALDTRVSNLITAIGAAIP